MLGEPLRLGAGCEHSQSGPTDFQMSLRSPPPPPPSSSAPFLGYSAEERSADAVRPPQPPSGYGFSSDRPMLRFGAPGMTPPPTEVPHQDSGFGSVDRREQVDQRRHEVPVEVPLVGYSDAPLMDPAARDELRPEARFRYEHRQSPHDPAMEREFQQQPSYDASTRSSDPCSRSSPPSDMIASNGDLSQMTDIQIHNSNQVCSDVKIEADEPSKSTSNSPSPSECEGDITDTAGGELDTNGGLNALQRLQNALEKNGTFNVYGEDGITATGTEIYQCHLCSYTGSSKFNFSQHMHSHYDFQCSQCDFKSNSNVELKEHMKIEHNLEIKDFMDEPGVRVPRVNASGKIRLHKCKFCEYKTPTQMEHWEHLKSHIPPEKRFWCHVCPFITDVKHHLTYHLRNHFNSKPFKCNKCEYSCVNKSMLSSHMKSHTNFYQYRCADCSFAAKYANALKNHLRKEKHRPGMVLNPDGTPNPFVIIDVYGTRRGPKIKKDDNGMPILPSSIQENYVNFVQSQTKYIGSPTSQPPSFVNPYMQSEIGVVSPDSKLALPRGYIKCDMCPFSTPDRDLLTKHMMNHMTPDSQKEGKRSPPPPSDEEPFHRSNGVERMELLRSALAQPVRPLVSPSGPPPPQHHQGPPPLPPPIYRHQDLSPQFSGARAEHAPAAETPRLPQYDPMTAQRVREYFSRALQTPLLYNLSMAAGLNSNPPAPPVTVAGLPLPFSICRTPLSTQLAAVHERVCSPQYVRVSSPQRPSSPPYYDHRAGNGFLSGHRDSPQPSTPPQQQLLRQHLQQHQLSLASETISPENDEVLDLSRLGKRSADGIVSMPAKHRRKGRAQRLEVIAQRLQTSGGGSPPSEGDSAAGSCSPPSDETAAARLAVHSDDDWRSEAHTCQSCGIAFKDLVMYTMHMGFHDFRRPFSCNKCGEQCRDAIAFFLHIARVPHTS